MPAVAVKGAIIVVSVAVAAAVAIYESPQARQFAEDVRRRIALALHSLGDEINPQSPHPRYNRPEDAEGFLQSRAEPGIDADEESQRRQREELMYWNAARAEKQERERKLAERAERPRTKSQGSTFDDFLEQDKTAESGTYVYNTGADVNHQGESVLRSRGVRALSSSSVYGDPFADQHQFEADWQRAIDASLMSPDASEKFEGMSGLYTASEAPRPSRETTATIAEQLVDVSEPFPDPPVSYPVMEELNTNTNFANMADHDSPFASIHAWSDNTTQSYRAASPAAPGSPLFSDSPESVPGEDTPTDSISLAGSVAGEAWHPRSRAVSEGDVMSVDGEGISTPGSWTEVGSVVSENEIRH